MTSCWVVSTYLPFADCGLGFKEQEVMPWPVLLSG